MTKIDKSYKTTFYEQYLKQTLEESDIKFKNKK